MPLLPSSHQHVGKDFWFAILEIKKAKLSSECLIHMPKFVRLLNQTLDRSRKADGRETGSEGEGRKPHHNGMSIRGQGDTGRQVRVGRWPELQFMSCLHPSCTLWLLITSKKLGLSISINKCHVNNYVQKVDLLNMQMSNLCK